SGWERRSTRAWSPRSSAAKRRARPRLPTPEGPCRRYACAGPSASAAESRRFASCCSDTAANAVKDHLGELRGRQPAVDGDDALRKPLRELAVGGVDTAAKVGSLPLEPVGPRHAPVCLSRVDQE